MTQRRPDDMGTPDDARLGELLDDLAPEDFDRHDPPADLWAGIAARVAGDAIPAAAEAPPVVLSGRRDRRGGSTRATRGPWLAAAAVVLLVAAIAGVLVAVVPDDPADTTPSERLVASAELGQLEPLGSTTASARLVEEGGRQHLVIAAVDMPPPPEGSDYELWLIDPGVTDPRSLGTVTGSEDVTIPRSIDPTDHPIVDISLEPRDGDAQHSGHSLMRGTLR